MRDIAEFSPVFLDLKFHDIPATVSRAINVARDLGARFLTVHERPDTRGYLAYRVVLSKVRQFQPEFGRPC